MEVDDDNNNSDGAALLLMMWIWMIVSIAMKCIGYGLLLLFTVSLVAGSDAGKMSGDFHWQFRLSAAFRTPILVFIVVPLSFAMNAYRRICMMIRGNPLQGSNYSSRVKAHDERVELVVKDVTAWHNNGRKQTMRTARPNWSQMSTKLGSNKGSSYLVDVSHLNHIVHVDEEAMTITCEPAVTMGDITHLLVHKDLALVCQAEMESLTIGGLSMGSGMETNSHHVGWFQETIIEYEIVTAEHPPKVRKIHKDKDPQLFYALPHSVGTLGFLVGVTVKLMRTKPYVKMQYIMTKSSEQLKETIHKLSLEAAKQADEHPDQIPYPQFLEATCYTKQTAVIQCGIMMDRQQIQQEQSKNPKLQINPINYWYKPFYYKHLESLLKDSQQKGYDTYEEILPLMHYYHRFTRSIFWEIEDMIPFSNHPLYRFFWGWMGAPEVSLLKLFQGPVIRKNSVQAHVVQESVMPAQYLQEGLDKFEQWWDIYPLLVFPTRIFNRGSPMNNGFLHPQQKYCAVKDPSLPEHDPNRYYNWGIWVDLSAYGVPKIVKEGGTFQPKKTIREFEHWTQSVGGFQIYYTDLFCTRKEYKKIYNHSLWEQARQTLSAHDAFPEPYDKVRAEPGIVDLSEEEALEAKLEKEKEQEYKEQPQNETNEAEEKKQ